MNVRVQPLAPRRGRRVRVGATERPPVIHYSTVECFNAAKPSANRADGISEIEGKAATGSGERAGKRSEFQIRG